MVFGFLGYEPHSGYTMAQGNDSQLRQAGTLDGTLDGTLEREPVLRAGRPADPAPVSGVAGTPPVSGTDEPVDKPDSHGGQDDVLAAEEGDSERPDDSEAAAEVVSDKVMAQSSQRRLRSLLKQCERVLLLDFPMLSMQGWPDNFSLAQARRRRDIWLFCATLSALIFLSGMTGFVPAWIAGGGFGIFALVVLAGIPAVRRLFASKPSYLELLVLRQSLMKDARKHVAHLEGDVGLLWQCAQMAEFNPTLKSVRFSGLVRLSEQRILPRSLIKREHIRLYLIYMLEAEKAYDRLQHAYFEGHQTAIDNGWKSVATTPETRD